MATRTFLDTSVLISGWRGVAARQLKALTILADPKREFICSPYVKLELLPKPRWNKIQLEVDFYEQYFLKVDEWVEDLAAMNDEALRLGTNYGLSAMDALHIAASYLAKVDEFITAERPNSPLHRVREFSVLTIY